MRPGCPVPCRVLESLTAYRFARPSAHSAREPVEPGQDAGYRLIDVGQHALVVVTGEERVLEPAAVQPGGEQSHAPSPGERGAVVETRIQVGPGGRVRLGRG
jgi:hypothetical protein